MMAWAAAAEFRAGGHRRTQHLAGGNLRNAVFLADEGRLGAFSPQPGGPNRIKRMFERSP